MSNSTTETTGLDQLQRLKLLQDENELMLLQLHQVQEELEHYVLLYQESERKADELAKWVESRGSLEVCGRGNLFHKLTDLLGITIHGKIDRVRSSGFFDETWYLQRYPDVAKSGLDPVEHYLRWGAAEGRDPGPQFDTKWYLNNYPDVAKAGLNPLLHYAQFGKSENRLPRRGGVQPPPNPFDAERKRLTSARDEQARLAAERQQQIDALIHVKGALEQEKSALAARRDALQAEVAALSQARDEQARLAAERQAEIGRLIQARDEQAKLAAERQGQLEALNQAKCTLEQEKSALAARCDALQGEVAALARVRDEQVQLAAERQQQIDALIHVKGALEQEKSALAARRDALQAEVAALSQARDEQARLASERAAQVEQLAKEAAEARRTTAICVRLQAIKEQDLQDLQSRYRDALRRQDEQHQLLVKLGARLGAAAAYFQQLSGNERSLAQDDLPANTSDRISSGPERQEGPQAGPGRDLREAQW